VCRQPFNIRRAQGKKGGARLSYSDYGKGRGKIEEEAYPRRKEKKRRKPLTLVALGNGWRKRVD